MMVDKEILCDKCKEKPISKIVGSNSGLYCKSCNEWVVVTTYIPDKLVDPTNYKIQLFLNSLPEKSQLKFLSKISQLNFLQLKQKINNGEPIIYVGQAQKISEILENIEDTKYVITPNFPY